jgi:hypothetical protein
MSFGWTLLTLVGAFGLTSQRPENFCRGRLSRLMTRHLKPRVAWRPQAPLYWSRGLLCMLLSQPAAAYSHLAQHAVFCLLFLGLFFDDYLFGDDDRWKRFKGWVGNKVKWKMTLPQPLPKPNSGTA